MPSRLTQPQNFLWIGLAAAGLVLLYYLSPILAPFLMAGILAYICNPVMVALEKRRIKRTLGAVIVMLGLFALLVLLLLILVPLFFKEIQLLSARLPGYLDELNTHVAPWLGEKFGVAVQFDAATLKRLLSEAVQGTEGLGMKVLDSLKIGGLTVLGFVANLMLVPVVLFYLLRDWRSMVARVDHMVPRGWHQKVRSLAGQVDAVLAEFLRGQMVVMLVMAAFYSAGLWLTGLEGALPIGLITGLLVFVPYIGSFTGFLLATMAALLQFESLFNVAWVWAVFFLGQTLEGMVVTPMLVGERIGLHPVAVIFALLAFGQVFGFFGVLLALPASAALLVGLRHLRAAYLASPLYGGPR